MEQTKNAEPMTVEPAANQKSPKKPGKAKKIIGVGFLILGILGLAAGATFLVMRLMRGPEVLDGEVLMETGRWEVVDDSGVIWEFTEIGKGRLTTNNHLNDYDFTWAIEGDKLKIKTEWLYPIYEEFGYRIEDGELILTREDGEVEELVEVKFRPASSVDTEVTEDDELVVGD